MVESLAILQRHLHAAVLAQGQFLGEQGIDHLQRAGFATLELAHGLVQDLQRPRHLQADQSFADAVEDGGDDLQGRVHGWLSLAGQALADGLVEVEWARGDDVTGAHDHDRLVATAIGDPRHLAMAWRDPALIAALQHGMRGDQSAVFEDPHLIGQRVHFDDPLPGRIGNAVEIAADAHHAFMRDPPFQLEHRAERRQRQCI